MFRENDLSVPYSKVKISPNKEIVNARARSLFRISLLDLATSELIIAFWLFQNENVYQRGWFYGIASPSLAAGIATSDWWWGAVEKPGGNLWSEKKGRRVNKKRNMFWLFDTHTGISTQATRPSIQTERKHLSDETPTLWSFLECSSFWQKCFLLYSHYRKELVLANQ